MTLFETPTDPFILGAVNAWGDIFHKTARDSEDRHPQGWRAYKTWRYIPDAGLLMWWETPDDGEKMTVEDWLERRGYDINIRSVMGQQLRVREVIKSQKGTPVKRYQNKVGKLVGPQLYVHRKYAAEVIPHDKLKFAGELLKQIKPTFRFNSVMWNKDTGEVRFDEAPDFDTAREPHVGKYLAISPDGTTREGQSNSIWHHKWLWVKDDYKRFDVDKAKEWSMIWLAKLPAIAKGTDTSFGNQLKQVGLGENVYGDARQAILTNTPTDIYGAEHYEGTHVEIVGRLFPKEMEYYKKVFERSGYGGGEESENDILYMAANAISRDKKLVRIVIENERLIFNTDQHIEPSPSQMRVLKNYAIEHGLELIHSKGMKSQHIDLIEGNILLKELLLMTEASKDEAALEWLKHMVQSGPFKGKVFLAGGAVRDMEMGKDPKDLDVVVIGAGLSGGIDFTKWLAQQMGNYKEGSNPVIFPTFGTAKVVLVGQYNGIDLDGMDVEAVASRKEQYTKGSRKPEVAPGTLEDDVFRRDFTVNSLVMDLTTGQILDLTGKGKADIKQGILRTTSDPDIIFGQDALRMFRAIRFATKYNWQLAPELVAGIKKNLENLGNTSRERVRDEINKILVTGNPRKGFELLRDTGLLPHVAKEFQQAVGMTQNIHHEEDVFGHTMSVLQVTKPELVNRLIALFHDIGKVATRSETPTGVHFYGHEDEGPAVAEKIMRDLKYPSELIDAVKLGIRTHMRLKHGGNDAVKLSDKSLRKFKIELGDKLEQVLDVIHADNVAHAGPSAMPNQIENVRKRLAALDIKVEKPKLPINGEDLKSLGLTPGPVFTKILSAVTDAWFENPNISRDEALQIAKKVIQ